MVEKTLRVVKLQILHPTSCPMTPVLSNALREGSSRTCLLCNLLLAGKYGRRRNKGTQADIMEQ